MKRAIEQEEARKLAKLSLGLIAISFVVRMEAVHGNLQEVEVTKVTKYCSYMVAGAI